MAGLSTNRILAIENSIKKLNDIITWIEMKIIRDKCCKYQFQH